MNEIDITDMIANVTDLIAVLNQIEGKNLNFPFHSFSLMFVDIEMVFAEVN